MVKEVKGCNRVIEITLDGTECAVKFDAKYNGFDIRNKSGKDITVSLKSGAAKGDDGVITIGDGETFNYMHMMGLDTVYITGSGAVAVAAKNEAAANFKAVRRGGETSKNGVLIGGTVYTGTEYNEQSKPISGLKDELTEYCGFGSDGDFIPCNADGTLGFTITSSIIQQNYGESKTKADESSLVSTYSIILKNDKIFAFKHGEKETHVIAKDTNGNPVLFWCWNSQYIITNPSGSTGYMSYLAQNNASYKHYIVPMCDFLAGNEIDGLYLVAASPSTSYTDYFVDFGGDIYRFFGQGGHQFAVKVST